MAVPEASPTATPVSRRPTSSPGRLFQAAHGGMQCGRTPEEVVEDPAGVIDELAVVVGALQEGEVVGGVRRQQADDAAHEEPERRCSPPGIDRESDRGSEQEHVAQWVGD